MTLDGAKDTIARHRVLAGELLAEAGHEDIDVAIDGEVEVDGYTFGRSDLIELAECIATNTATLH